MNPTFETYTPNGFSTVNACLFVSNPEELISFLKLSFYAEELNRSIRPDTEEIANCILKIGKSSFMISQASGQFENMRTALYLYTKDVDRLYRRALINGAESVFAPEDMDYGDRQGGIIDPSGNYWWISMRLEEKDYEP